MCVCLFPFALSIPLPPPFGTFLLISPALLLVLLPVSSGWAAGGWWAGQVVLVSPPPTDGRLRGTNGRLMDRLVVQTCGDERQLSRPVGMRGSHPDLWG